MLNAGEFTPATMSKEAFAHRLGEMAQRAEDAPHNKRAPIFRAMADLCEREGFPFMADSWRGAARYADETYGKG